MPHVSPSQALFTDLYELTMAQAYWQSGQTAEATFSLFFRTYPPNRSFFIFAGLPDVLDYIENFHFSVDDIDYLGSLGQFDPGFLDFLSRVRFTGSVRAMEEATPVFVNEPVIEVTAPVIESQILETSIVNEVALQTMLATKAARVVRAARDRTVVDFGARRSHGRDAADKLARASYMVGFAGTSNVRAGALYDIPTFGTMAHSFVEAYEDETESFRAYADSFPHSSTFLVDTYDTIEGTQKAIEVAREMKRRGHVLQAIRLDSGDLLNLSVRSREMLDRAGLEEVEVFASGGLDEYAIELLLDAGAPIDGFGVGTKVGVSADAPYADCVYKMVEYDGKPVLKLSSEKETLPGPKQVYRTRDAAGLYSGDVICRAGERPPETGAQPLLFEIMREGELVTTLPGLEELRQRFAGEFASLRDNQKALEEPPHYEVAISQELQDLDFRVKRDLSGREAHVERAEAD